MELILNLFLEKFHGGGAELSGEFAEGKIDLINFVSADESVDLAGVYQLIKVFELGLHDDVLV
jgi:hypothetical protein